MKMAYTLSRRGLMKSVLVAGVLTPAFGLFTGETRADTLTPLDANDPNAKALNYVADASKVDARVSPTFKVGQHCGLCAHYRGKQTDPVAGCEIFMGHSVPAPGWCMVWGARSS
jgi:High potential iron-sulfur protein